MKQNNQPLWSWVVPLLVSIALIVFALLFREKLETVRSLGLLGIFIANLFASATFFLPAPGIATVVAGGALYPPFLVGLVASLGAALGDIIGFLFGVSGKRMLSSKEGKRYAQVVGLFKHFGGVVIFVFALVPNPIFDGVGFVAGALGYPLSKFFLWLFLGRFVRNILLAYLGLSFANL